MLNYYRQEKGRSKEKILKLFIKGSLNPKADLNLTVIIEKKLMIIIPLKFGI